MDLEVLSKLDELKAAEYGRIKKKVKENNVDILDFYPDLDLITPYTSSNSATSNNIKPYQLLPFFKTIIVDVIPLPNEDLFERYYGVSVEELIELERKERAVIRLPGLYSHYKGLDYLDPILSRRPHSSFLVNLVFGSLINDKIVEQSEEIENFFKEKDFDFGNNVSMEMGMIDPLVLVSSDIITGNKPYLGNFTNNDYIKFTRNNFLKLNYAGYNNVNRFIKGILDAGHGRLDWAFSYSSAYASFLADPLLNSLNGTHMASYNMKEILNDLILRTSNETLKKGFLSKSSEILSYDLGRTLSEEIVMHLPLNIDDALAFDSEGAIDALNSLEKVITDKNSDEIIEFTSTLQNELSEAGQIVEGMRDAKEKHTTNISHISTTISLLGAGAAYLSEDPNIKPILYATSLISKVIGSTVKTESIQKLIEGVFKLNKSDHVLFLYKNHGKFSITPKTREIRVLNSKKAYSDTLSMKYDYYEYIYKNIPILRVLIDITARMIVGKGLSLKYTGNDEVPDTKMMEMLEKWRDENLHDELIILQMKYSLLYGKSFFLKTVIKKGKKRDIKLKMIHPKIIRPFYKNRKLKGYKILNERGDEQLFHKDDIVDFKPTTRNISFVEKYIYLFDEIYPNITNKENRPKLLYDILFEDMDKAGILSHQSYGESEALFLNSLKLAQFLENWLWTAIILMSIGDLNRQYNSNEKALEYYLKANDHIEGKVFSGLMEKIEMDLNNRIIETQQILWFKKT
ncbi:tetratricopeptide repeat protein [Methanobacterium formicicum]|uniref:Uncharacterized protein n=1 Tax=Methanobacterium formicicum (strain DSM 3637 / PP1) TaxID=1204725 RepID=K2R4P0_METFP|nr:tetratricopeptide repeat protein [Methanobacterium formicicum]EKF86192.1 hypothetical protein A994_04530 [Methanobacterium formicicum DSM 3637]